MGEFSPDEYAGPTLVPAVELALVREGRDAQRARVGGPVMFPRVQRNERMLQRGLMRLRQLAEQAMSARGRPIVNSLPLNPRLPAAWVFDTTDLRWGLGMGPSGSLVVWDGRPLRFEESPGIRPHLTPWNPWQQFPNIERDRPGPRDAPTLRG